MTRIPAAVGALGHPGRILATATLAALVLTGCGADESSGGGARGGSAGSKASATSLSPEQAAFAAMLDKFAQRCSPADGAASGPADEKSAGPEGKQSLDPGEVPPTGLPTGLESAGPEGKQSLDPGETPPADPVVPDAPTGPEAELNARDWCASGHHQQRIIEALQAVPDPTPAKVRKTLNGLGYIDERIHGLEQDGKATRFYLDLRENGGQLCEAGLAMGAETEVTACTAPATGVFEVEKTEE
ncbi:hypothetical protein ACFYW8_10310 [Streptomyces sp. NPDC002742]|uniref:hypothetical protein n=1 Tax=Streptomyces sp. NPDC002742 TaxID=3364663 RepID=UPI0036BD12B5